MYGLIHSALERMIKENHGDAIWQAIVERSGASNDAFLTMRSYDDKITMALVSAAAEELSLPVDTCLEEFGIFWLMRFAPDDYGMLLDRTGSTPIEFLSNLDALHDRISTVFSKFRPPSFSVAQRDGNSVILLYRSPRVGLTPFVVGLMKGVAQRFGSDLELEIVETTASETGEVTKLSLTFLEPS